MPNAKVLSEKQAIVAALAERLKGASAGVFVDYKGITVAEDTDNAGSCALQLLGQRGHDRLLFRQNFCVRHFLSSPPLDFAARLACQGKEAF